MYYSVLQIKIALVALVVVGVISVLSTALLAAELREHHPVSEQKIAAIIHETPTIGVQSLGDHINEIERRLAGIEEILRTSH